MMRCQRWLGIVLPFVFGTALLVALGCGGCSQTGTSHPGGSESAATGEALVMVSGLEGLTGKVDIDGSSTVYPVTEAVAEEFQNATNQKVKVTVGISGTGGGFKKFNRGEIDISDASRPILKEEMKTAAENGIEFVELPICFDALTVAVNRAADWVDSITVAELKKIWEPSAEGKITHWNQIRPQWPKEKLVLFGAGTDSGTFDYFTEAINGKAKASRGDYTASEDDNTLVQGIEGNKYALGYIPYAYFEPNKSRMKALKVIPAGKEVGVEPNAQTVASGAYTPLSRPLLLYVNRKSTQRTEVKKFAEFYLKNAAILAAEVKYIPLPPESYRKVLVRLENMEVGSAFGGTPEVGLHIDEILNRQPQK